MDLRQSPEYARYLEKSGWKIEKIGKNQIFIRYLPLLPFSVLKLQRPEKLPPLEKIESLAQKHHSFLISIEPSSNTSFQSKNFSRFGYRLSRSPFLPTKTLKLDLTSSKEKILQQMKKNTRLIIKSLEKKKLLKIAEHKTESELKNFHSSWKKAVDWKRFVPSFKNLFNLKKSFPNDSLFLTCYHDTNHGSSNGPNLDSTHEKIIAGSIILFTPKTAYYFYAFTSKKGRKLFAQYLLVWTGIQEAKKRNCHFFDFEGIYDLRFPIKSWQGFSFFKKSFGAKEVNFPGCFQKWRFPW